MDYYKLILAEQHFRSIDREFNKDAEITICCGFRGQNEDMQTKEIG